jgi:hypothetical protein
MVEVEKGLPPIDHVAMLSRHPSYSGWSSLGDGSERNFKEDKMR